MKVPAARKSTLDTPRARRQLQTREKIARAALALFVERGYDQTTLDAIADAADISRRTFFSYFKSKEEVFHATLSDGFVTALSAAFVPESSKRSPYVVVGELLPRLVARFETKESIVVDRVMQESETLRARKQAIFAEWERTLYEALGRVWTSKAERATLQLVAMMGVGVLRVALERWRAERAKRPLADHVREGFRAVSAFTSAR